MNEEEIREAIKNFKFYTAESKRLYASLESGESLDMFSLQIGSSKREDQARRKLEKMDRKITILLQVLREAGLTDKEWSVVDCLMEGMSCRSLGREFGCSRRTIERLFSTACKKMANYLLVAA